MNSIFLPHSKFEDTGASFQVTKHERYLFILASDEFPQPLIRFMAFCTFCVIQVTYFIDRTFSLLQFGHFIFIANIGYDAAGSIASRSGQSCILLIFSLEGIIFQHKIHSLIFQLVMDNSGFLPYGYSSIQSNCTTIPAVIVPVCIILQLSIR